jgi:hypothetical protein
MRGTDKILTPIAGYPGNGGAANFETNSDEGDFVTDEVERRMRMKNIALIILSTLVFLATGSVAFGGDLFFYPSKGQSTDQQEKDEFECYKWAKNQSGVDPSAPAAGPDRGERAAGTVGGAAKGAAAGAVIGAIAGDAGKGAAIGAAGGGVMGRRGAKQREQAEAAGERSAYNRAVAACMESRGYAVK